MTTYLLVDIGAGTMDILYYDDQTQWHYKAVVPSPVRELAQTIQSISENLVVTGNEMGGGPVSGILRERAANGVVVMTAAAAATIHHDIEKVRATGINVVPDAKAEDLLVKSEYREISLGDLQIDRLKQIISTFGVPYAFDVVGICAQDHGVPPPGVSHLDYRHQLFEARLDRNPYPHSLLYEESEIPPAMNRLTCIARDARKLPTHEIYVMDSGMAAILGASFDVRAESKENLMVLDIATSHTVGALLQTGAICGFFEYHTRDITLEKLESLLRDQADGRLIHENILNEGGHGAYTRKALGFDKVEVIIATGPKRQLMENTKLPIAWGAPWGDNMMTGTVGLLAAIRKRKNLMPLTYR